MFQVHLAEEEKQTLIEVLENALADIRMEIADTDSTEFKAQLRTRKETLTRILEALGKAAETA